MFRRIVCVAIGPTAPLRAQTGVAPYCRHDRLTAGAERAQAKVIGLRGAIVTAMGAKRTSGPCSPKATSPHFPDPRPALALLV